MCGQIFSDLNLKWALSIKTWAIGGGQGQKIMFNGLQVNMGGGRAFDRKFTKSLMIRDFDDVLKNPFRYVHLFLLHTLLSKKIPKIAMHDL